MATTSTRSARQRKLPLAPAYLAGAALSAIGLIVTATDQLALGHLDSHLHALYDGTGAYGQAGPLYGYLYAVGVLGLLCWWGNLRLVHRRSPAVRRVGWITLALSALVVFAPIVMREHGQLVIPLQLSAGSVLAWVCGAVGLLAAKGAVSGSLRRAS